MQMTVELTEEQVRRLDEKGAAENSSREEVVGKAVNAYVGLIEVPPQFAHLVGEKRDFPELDAVFGIWKDRGEDTFEYIRRIREGE